MGDRRKELIKQWLQELTGNEEEPAVARNPASNRFEDQLKPGNALDCYKQSVWGTSGTYTSGLERRKICYDVKFPLNRRRKSGNQVLHRNVYHLHDHDHEGAKYRAMLQQFLRSQNLVFCFPPRVNSSKGRLSMLKLRNLASTIAAVDKAGNASW